LIIRGCLFFGAHENSSLLLSDQGESNSAPAEMSGPEHIHAMHDEEIAMSFE
jgi:hypothetical protein